MAHNRLQIFFLSKTSSLQNLLKKSFFWKIIENFFFFGYLLPLAFHWYPRVRKIYTWMQVTGKKRNPAHNRLHSPIQSPLFSLIYCVVLYSEYFNFGLRLCVSRLAWATFLGRPRETQRFNPRIIQPRLIGVILYILLSETSSIYNLGANRISSRENLVHVIPRSPDSPTLLLPGRNLVKLILFFTYPRIFKVLARFALG